MSRAGGTSSVKIPPGPPQIIGIFARDRELFTLVDGLQGACAAGPSRQRRSEDHPYPQDLGDSNLRHMVRVADREFASAANRANPQRGDGHYIHRRKLRHTNAETAAALARAGSLAKKSGQPARQGGRGQPQRRPARRHPHRTVRRRLPRPRGRRPRQSGPRTPHRTPARPDRQLRRVVEDAERVRRLAQGQARAASLPPPHPQRTAAHRPRRRQTQGRPGRHFRHDPHPPRTRPPPTTSSSPSSEDGATARDR